MGGRKELGSEFPLEIKCIPVTFGKKRGGVNPCGKMILLLHHNEGEENIISNTPNDWIDVGMFIFNLSVE